MSTVALVRALAPSLAHCELTYLAREPIDADRAADQHRGYLAQLAAFGCRLEWLPPLPAHADGAFVEDTALLVAELAVIARPGAESRRGETGSTAAALARHRPLASIAAPATLEGGDVLRIGRTLYVGASGRTNAAGIGQLAAMLEPLGYVVRGVALSGCLHLKSACTFIPPDLLLANPAWVDPGLFDAGRVVAVDEREAFGANTLTVGGVTLVSADFPRTQRRLQAAGVSTRALDVSELHKAEAALTCMSLLLETPPGPAPG
jgi:dimethylargininase